MSTGFERQCTNCAHAFNGIDEEPCKKCSHIYDDKWEPINPMLINAAKMIKQVCSEYECINCPFHNPGKDPVCSLAPKDDNNIPSTWEV